MEHIINITTSAINAIIIIILHQGRYEAICQVSPSLTTRYHKKFHEVSRKFPGAVFGWRRSTLSSLARQPTAPPPPVGEGREGWCRSCANLMPGYSTRVPPPLTTRRGPRARTRTRLAPAPFSPPSPPTYPPTYYLLFHPSVFEEPLLSLDANLSLPSRLPPRLSFPVLTTPHLPRAAPLPVPISSHRSCGKAWSPHWRR